MNDLDVLARRAGAAVRDATNPTREVADVLQANRNRNRNRALAGVVGLAVAVGGASLLLDDDEPGAPAIVDQPQVDEGPVGPGDDRPDVVDPSEDATSPVDGVGVDEPAQDVLGADDRVLADFHEELAAIPRVGIDPPNEPALRALVVPGSPAETVLEGHLARHRTFTLDQTGPTGGPTARVSGGAILVAGQQEEGFVEVSDPVVQDGRLVSWSRDGTPLEELITMVDATVEAAGVTVGPTIVWLREPLSFPLVGVAHVAVTAPEDVDVTVVVATWVDEAGEEHRLNLKGASPVVAGATHWFAGYHRSLDALAGTLRLEGRVADVPWSSEQPVG